MRKTLFQALRLIFLFSLVCSIVVWLYSCKTNVLMAFHDSNRYVHKPSELERIIKQRVHELLNKNPIEKAISGDGSSLGTCPDTPPGLVGPLRVDFDWQQTMEEVRKDANSSLQEGGQYKPPDCIALQRVAIIIPFRNRHEHLKHWLYYLHPILQRQQLDYGVYVINQDGDGVFNRAKLLNVGFVEALKEYAYDCFVFSDVDLVPMNDRNLYRCFDEPRHLSVAMDKFNYKLPYKTYFGGVASFSKDQYLKINGFPNSYWGWGAEDDDIYKRIAFHKMSISRPDSHIGKYKMIKHKRDLHNEPDPKNPDKLFKTIWTMEKDGINSLIYTVKKIEKDALYTFITVDIHPPK
ncbi:beta-1,4-galactosyltransferase 1-like [Centroberyx affinis]|uniref:beta-1,4-galactosyltransferase 1-like n=1 Tax=Centroberyx affinis TaxID=166261 RepID=UPI003A5BD766